ncbi:unnamed protein product [Urochloa decumbens]|uniref:BTB domain-containing protein n=1 Tax=Urochloa decumbens TaxID=240449 RepID=A0ABC9BSH2_9POAL
MSDGSMFDSCSFTHQFKINLAETKDVAIGRFVCSDEVSAGVTYGRSSVTTPHESESKDAKAIFEAFLMDRNGTPSSTHRKRLVHTFTPKGGDSDNWGWFKFVERSVLESLYVTSNGSFILMCGFKVVPDNPLDDFPPSDMGSHLGILLDSTEGSDVSFVVDGEKFPAHRAMLSARSPVFKAQLLGSMADAKMESITLHDIAPDTFRVMLRFMYTDAFPEDSELGDSPKERLQDLFTAADRFALDRLKLLCARKMWEDVSAETICAILACAETYNCQELKKKCIDFFADEKNFRNAVLTDGSVQLVLKFPSILAELKVKP